MHSRDKPAPDESDHSELKGPFIIVTRSGAVFGATHVEATPEGFTIFLKGIQHRLKAPDLEIVYAVAAQKPAARIDPGLISTLVWLENALIEFNRTNPPTHITLIGAGSLAFTILPERSTMTPTPSSPTNWPRFSTPTTPPLMWRSNCWTKTSSNCLAHGRPAVAR